MVKSVVPHLSLASTQIEDRIEANLTANDWVACQKCAQEYRPFVLKEGVCDICRKAIDACRTKLGEVFKGRERLLEMSRKAFTITESNRAGYDAGLAFNPLTDNLYLFSQACPNPCRVEHEHCSGAGTGKTMLAAKIIRKAVSDGHATLFESPEKWLRSLYDLKGNEQQKAIDRLAYSRVLALDDMGLEPITDSGFSVRALYEVINSRWLKNLNGLVITSNMTLDMLSDHLRDDRITSRIGGMCRVIEMSGRDWRQPE